MVIGSSNKITDKKVFKANIAPTKHYHHDDLYRVGKEEWPRNPTNTMAKVKALEVIPEVAKVSETTKNKKKRKFEEISNTLKDEQLPENGKEGQAQVKHQTKKFKKNA